MLKNKKVIIIILSILILLAIGATVYFLWFRGGARPAVEEKPIQKLSTEKMMGVKYLPGSNKIRFLSLGSLTIKEFDLNSKQTTELSKIPLDLVRSIIWSPDEEKAILKVENNRALLSQRGYLLDQEAPDGTITTWSFDIKNQNLVELSRGIGGIDWLDNDKIIYYFSQVLINPEIEGEGSSSLSQADFDGRNFQKIMDLETSKFYNSEISLSPDKKQALLSPEIEGIGKNSIYLVDLTNKTTTEISENGLTVLGSWSSGGRSIFLYQADEKNPENQNSEIWLVNKAGVEKKKLGLKAAYPLVITDKQDKYIYLASTYNNKPAVFQVNSGSLEKKIIADIDQEPGLNNITEIGLLNEGIFVVADGIIYAIQI